MRSSRLYTLICAALAAALMCVAAQLSIQLGPIPLTLQLLAALLLPFLLRPFGAAAAMGIYILLGLAGLPVFASGGGGIGYVLKPSFGFIPGMAAFAVLGSVLHGKLLSKNLSGWKTAALRGAIMLLTVFGTYAVGVLYMFLILNTTGTEVTFSYCLACGVLPFILPDIIKCAIALAIVTLLRPALEKAHLV